MEEDEFDEEIDDEKKRIVLERLNYKQVKCDAIAWSEDKGLFNLILFRDATQKTYYAKLDEEGVRRLQKWCNEWMARKAGNLAGYG